MHLKKLIKIGELLRNHFNIEDGRKKASFSAHYALLFQERWKRNWNTKKDLCSVWRRCYDWLNTSKKWFEKFRAGDFSLDDAPWSGRPAEVDSDQIETLIENNQHYTTRETADILKVSKSSTENHPNQLGYVHHFDAWVPRKLTEENLLDHISACHSLLKRNENVPFLKQIVTGDEKWTLHDNVERERSWGKGNEPPPTTPKAGLHPKKVMLCICWDWKGVLYYELLPENQKVNSNGSQWDQLKAALDEKCPELVNRKRIIFHQDNTGPHVSLMTR